MVKDAQECASIRRACEITDLAFSAMCEMIRPGMTEAEIDRVHAPIGLPILAETPEEIAISIAAEMIEHRARRAGAGK